MTGPSERDMRRLRNPFPPPRPLRIWASAGSVDDAANRVRRDWVDVTPSGRTPAVEAAAEAAWNFMRRTADLEIPWDSVPDWMREERLGAARAVVAALSDPALGDDALVRFGDALDAIAACPRSWTPGMVAAHLERLRREGHGLVRRRPLRAKAHRKGRL
jgi:hypothetical protein